MSPRCTRALIGGATTLGMALLAALPSTMSASAAATATALPKIKPGHVFYEVHSSITPAQASAVATSLRFTHYTSKVRVCSKSYPYTIAGKNPPIKPKNPASTIKVELVSLVIKFADGKSWNPAEKDSCDRGASALARTQISPIFKRSNISFGGTK